MNILLLPFLEIIQNLVPISGPFLNTSTLQTEKAANFNQLNLISANKFWKRYTARMSFYTNIPISIFPAICKKGIRM